MPRVFTCCIRLGVLLVHASKDKVLLHGDTYGDSDDGNDDEVFALKGLDRDEDENENEDYYEDDEDFAGQYNGSIDSTAFSKTPKSKKKEEKKKNGKRQKDSDDKEAAEEEEEETWGRGKAAYYSSNAAQLESDDEEGQELEEQEARRLQKKALEGTTDEDFGLNDKRNISGAGDPPECV
jgi:U3 small nucleolar RNA-associated protein 3